MRKYFLFWLVVVFTTLLIYIVVLIFNKRIQSIESKTKQITGKHDELNENYFKIVLKNSAHVLINH